MSDLIDRQEAINIASGFCHPANIAKELAKLPSAQPERKKGRWMFFETENDKYEDIKCPFCKKTHTVDAYRICDIGFIAEDFKFCPNCGADMRGENRARAYEGE